MGHAQRPSVFKIALYFKMKHRQVSGSELWSLRMPHPGLPDKPNKPTSSAAA